MSKLVINLPGNTWHSNVSAHARRTYIEELPAWVQVLKEAGMPILSSFQQTCLDLAGLTERDFEGLDLLAAAYNHALFSLISGRDGLPEHAAWLVEHGVKGNVDGAFWNEFDTPNRDMHPGRSMVYFSVPSQSFLYSECDERTPTDAQRLEGYSAVRFHNHVVVPMHGCGKAQGAFFKWQRLWDDASRAEMVAAFREIVEDGKDGIVVFFMDLEAPIVGSHHGLDVWRQFFRILREEGIADHVIGFKDAEKIWRAEATRPKQTFSLLARKLGTKWTAWNQQIILLFRTLRLRPARTDRDHAVMACFTTSDLYSALGTELDAQQEPPKPRDADLGPITIGFDRTVTRVGHIAIDAYETGKNPARELVSYDWEDPDARWFAERVANRIGAFAD